MQLTRPFRSTALACSILFVTAAPARAADEVPKPATASAVTPPRLTHDPGVAYPQAALDRGFYERVNVALIVDVDVEGRVKTASVERPGVAEFDSAAIAAASGLRFAPALRQGVSVAARIRFRYVFDPPPAALSGRVVDQRSGSPVAGVRVVLSVAGGSALSFETDANGSFRSESVPFGAGRVRIESERHAPQEAAVALTPGSETRLDVELVPHVAEAKVASDARPPETLEVVVHGERKAPAVTTLTREEVRQMPGAFGDPFRAIEALPGVTPIGSGLPFFYVRGAPPGNVGYFLDGIRVPFLYHVAIGPSVVHPGLVDRVDLYSGGYPARHGRFAGGIVAAETTTPRQELHGEANVRLLDAGALAEGGFAGGRGTALLGGRYSYTAALLSVFVPDLILDYRDYQARFTYDLTEDDRVGLFAFGSYDLLAEEQAGATNVLFGAEFYRADLSHEHRLSRGSLETHVTFGFDQTHMGDEGNSRDHSVNARSEFRHELGARAELRAGVELTLDRYTTDPPRYVDPASPEVRNFLKNSPDRTDRAFGVFNDYVIDVGDGVEVIPGLRLDLYQSLGASAVGIDPRVAARFEIGKRLTLVHTFGVAHQPPSFALPLPGRAPASLNGGLQRAIQASSGAEVELGSGTTLKSSLFYNLFSNMTDALATNAEGPPDAAIDQRADGAAYGLELFLHRSLTKRLGGFVSYTLSRSMRNIAGETFPSSFDRTHVANAAVAYDLGRKWRAGARLVFYTGTPVEAAPNAPRDETPARTDPFFRVDVRLEKRWDLSERVWLSFVTEVMNATLSKESFGDEEVGPITIPSIGLELGF